MGELHLDIIKDRILKEYKLKAYFGPLNISYKEMPTKSVEEAFILEKSLNEKKNSVEIELKIIPSSSSKFKNVIVSIKNEINAEEIPIEYLNAINHGIRSALNKGVLLHYPVINIDIHLTRFNVNKSILIPYITSAAYQCTLNALKNAELVIIQPVMRIDVS